LAPPQRLIASRPPRGGRDAIGGWARDSAGRAYLRVRVAAPPIDGAANAALVALIAKALSRPARAVRIASGEHGRLKSLEIEGVDPADLQQAFGEPG
jgi:hypothetical protein